MNIICVHIYSDNPSASVNYFTIICDADWNVGSFSCWASTILVENMSPPASTLGVTLQWRWVSRCDIARPTSNSDH